MYAATAAISHSGSSLNPLPILDLFYKAVVEKYPELTKPHNQRACLTIRRARFTLWKRLMEDKNGKE